MIRCSLVSFAVVAALTLPILAESPPVDEAMVLKTLRPGHPRLVVLDDDIARVRTLIETDPMAREIRDEVRRSAERLLDEPTVEHKLIGPRLLDQSRRCLGRVLALAAMYRLEGDRRFAARAEKEMLAAAAFPDWNPSHFLDTAEMSNALGIGYDWLYDVLPPESRQTIRTAIVEKGLKPGEAIYRKGTGWSKAIHNWNQVCNGGMTVGALAIADEEPELAAYIVAQAAQSIPRAMASLAPDGGWAEGPGYWGYAMSYTAFYVAAVQTALGSDLGLLATSGFADAGLFRIHGIGPSRQTFNFADAGASIGGTPQMMYFARVFDRPVYAWHQRRFRSSASPLDLLWFDPRGSDADGFGLPLDTWFKGVNVVFLRSSWSEPDAVFVGFKGGDNRANHSHLDLGTFVLDALGQRWAVDLGPDDYNLPAYFGKNRWTYYRLRTEGQNTLVLNGDNQDPAAKAPIIAFKSTPQRSFAIADLSAAYAKHAERVQRGIALLDRSQVIIQDEIEADKPIDVAWSMHTTAKVKIDGNLATLSQAGKEVRATLLEPADARWSAEPVQPAEPQRPLKDTVKLQVNLAAAASPTRLVVAIAPVNLGREPKPPTVEPLTKWATD